VENKKPPITRAGMACISLILFLNNVNVLQGGLKQYIIRSEMLMLETKKE
jgi:hypothetical protein